MGKEDHPGYLYTHGDDLNIATHFDGPSKQTLVKRVRAPASKIVDSVINNHSRIGRFLASWPSRIQRGVFEQFLPPNTTGVVGHTHSRDAVRFHDERALITSGSSFGFTLRNGPGSAKFTATVLDGGQPKFEVYEYTETGNKVKLIDSNEAEYWSEP